MQGYAHLRRTDGDPSLDDARTQLLLTSLRLYRAMSADDDFGRLVDAIFNFEAACVAYMRAVAVGAGETS
jgi:hypothetical protein